MVLSVSVATVLLRKVVRFSVAGKALSRAGVAGEEVPFLEAHGTGTSLGDPIEVRAVAESYRKLTAGPFVMGTAKTNVGHCESAAGIVGVIKAVLSMEKGWMTKQGGRVKTWKRRWFVLSNNVVYYFKQPEDKEPLGIIPLETTCAFDPAPPRLHA